MRIWDEGFRFRPNDSEELRDTEKEYSRFKDEIIWKGFELLARRQLLELGLGVVEPILLGRKSVGYISGDVAYFLSSGNSASSSAYQTYALEHGASRIVIMRENYRSNVFKLQSDSWIKVESDAKPKTVVTILHQCES